MEQFIVVGQQSLKKDANEVLIVKGIYSQDKIKCITSKVSGAERKKI